MESVLNWLGPMLVQYAQEYPLLASVVMVLGTFRLFFKPVMTIVQNVIDLTPSTKDDEFLAKMLDSKIYKGFAFFVDWIASIKLPKKE